MTQALIIVDMLNDFVNDGGALYCGDHVKTTINNIKSKMEEYRAKDLPIIFLCDNHRENDVEFERFPKHCVKGTYGAEIVAPLTPNKNHPKTIIVPKTRFSGFFKTNLEDIINSLKVNQIEVCGVCTHICVMDTVAHFANMDIKTVVDKGCVADFNQDAENAAISRMEFIYGTTIINKE